MLNYHELTMNESRDSPQRRKQFLIICTIMASIFVHTLFTSGALSSLDIFEGTFPGGDFVYKYLSRDYSTSQGVLQDISRNDLRRKRSVDPTVDYFYTLFLDNPVEIGGIHSRFASGILVNNQEGKEEKNKLMATNSCKKDLFQDHIDELTFQQVVSKIKFESTNLPSAKALVCNHAFTNGFVSALVQTYKVIPAMREYAKRRGQTNPVVISTCSASEKMCTHYVPMTKGQYFLLSRPDSNTHQASLKQQDGNAVTNWKKVAKGIRKKAKLYLPFNFFIGNDDKQADEL